MDELRHALSMLSKVDGPIALYKVPLPADSEERAKLSGRVRQKRLRHELRSGRATDYLRFDRDGVAWYFANEPFMDGAFLKALTPAVALIRSLLRQPGCVGGTKHSRRWTRPSGHSSTGRSVYLDNSDGESHEAELLGALAEVVSSEVGEPWHPQGPPPTGWTLHDVADCVPAARQLLWQTRRRRGHLGPSNSSDSPSGGV